MTRRSCDGVAITEPSEHSGLRGRQVQARVTIDLGWRATRSSRRVVVAKAVLRMRGGTTVRTSLRLTPLGRSLINRHRVLRPWLAVIARDPAGNVARGERAVILALPRTTTRPRR